MEEVVKLEEFKDIHLDEILEVRFGEYRGTSEVIYRKAKENM
jgi:hypothetical protein